MRFQHFWRGLLGLVLLLALFCQSAIAVRTPTSEEAAPEFFLITLDGKYLSLEDLKGKVVLLDFWATWCGPCRKAVPHLRELSRKMKDAPFALVGLSVDQEEDDLRAFVEAESISWPQYRDGRRELVQLYRVRGYPTYVVIDHRGDIVFRFTGWSERIEKVISAEVSKAVRNAMKGAKNSR